MGGQGEVCGDGLAEVVGHVGVAFSVFGEPAVEQVAVPGWILGRPAGAGAVGNGLLAESCVVIFEGDGVLC